MTNILMRYQHGLVEISPRSEGNLDPTSATTVRLAVEGGVLAFDVRKSDPIPTLWLGDLDEASGWLSGLIGGPASEVVIDFGNRMQDLEFDLYLSHPEETTGTVQEDAELSICRGPLLDPLRRVALGLWLRRWWPQESSDHLEIPQLTRWLLDVEVAAIAQDLEGILDSRFSLDRFFSAPHIPKLATTLWHRRNLGNTSTDQVELTQVLRSAAQTALEVVDEGTNGLELLGTVEDFLLALERGDTNAQASFDEVGINQRLFLLTLEEAGPDFGPYNERSMVAPEYQNENQAAIAKVIQRRVNQITKSFDLSGWNTPFTAEVWPSLGNSTPLPDLAVVSQWDAPAAMDDFEIEWLILSETSLALRGPGISTSLTVTDTAQGFRIDLRNTARGWRLRVVSLGGEGDITVSLKLTSGHTVQVELRVTAGGSADTFLGLAPSDAPIAACISIID